MLSFGWLLVGVLGLAVKGASVPSVTVTNGTVNGFMYNGASCFLGIPFAQPPVGGLRFQNPVPSGKWTTPLPGNKFAPACPQLLSDGRSQTGYSEDCLYLNVFSPNLNGKLPVLVVIHGGKFMVGSSQQFGYKGLTANLCSRGILVVTITYRLNVFGFFTTNTGDFPPNLGIMDQMTALRWVQEEIGKFGGDPSRVTIMGESAGSVSVSILTYSPLAKGLFHQAIMESGVAPNPWATTAYGYPGWGMTSQRTAFAANCSTLSQWSSGNFIPMKTCMRGLPWQKLFLLGLAATQGKQVGWKPSIFTIDGLLPDWPRKLAPKRTPIPVMLGDSQDEFYSFVLKQLLDGSMTFSDFNPTLFSNSLVQLSETYGTYATQVQLILQQNFRPSASPLDFLTWFRACIKMNSAADFFSGVLEEALSWQNISSRTFLFNTEYVTSSFPWPKYLNQPVKGVFHAMELQYIFQTYKWKPNPKDMLVSEWFGKAWSNFVISGNPNTPVDLGVRWAPFTPTSDGTHPYYSIDLPPSMKPDFHPESNQVFLKTIPQLTGHRGHTLPVTSTQSASHICLVENPCSNGGTCFPIGPSYQCICPPGFIGPKCTIPNCVVNVANRGVYLLRVVYSDANGPQSAIIPLGRNLQIVGVRNSTLVLSAVLGKSSSCPLNSSRCSANPAQESQITCTGTTLNFACSGCP